MKTSPQKTTKLEQRLYKDCEAFCQQVCVTLGDEFASIQGACRARPYTDVRHVLMAFAVHEFGLTYCLAGHLFSRDHTTVMNGVRKCKELLRTRSGGAFFDRVYQTACSVYRDCTPYELKTLNNYAAQREN